MTIGRKLPGAAGCLILAALVYAPWAMGCVKPMAVRGLAVITFTSAALWIAGLILERRRPRIPRIGLACVALLLLLGWGMVLNAHGLYDGSTDRFIHISSWWPSGPGAVDGPVCRAMMVQITAVLVALLVACDLAADRAWRWRLISTIALTGFSIAAWGLLQKMGLLPALAHREYAASPFATYDYHGNAGAYLNLIIPAVFALAVRRHRPAGAAALLICVAAAMVNVSRAAAAICILIVFLLVGWKKQAGLVSVGKQQPWLTSAVVTAFVIVTLAAGGTAWTRWNQVASLENTNNPRLIMLKIAAPMAVDAGPFGDGPGSFKLLYPTSPHMLKALYPRWKVAPYHPGEETSIYSYVHDDYVQFAIEWGWIGASLWVTLIATAVMNGLQAYRQGEDRIVMAVSLIALAGVMIHALVDWPLQVASLQLDMAVYLAILLTSQPCASC